MWQYIAALVMVTLLLVSYQHGGASSAIASSSRTSQEQDKWARVKDRPELGVDIGKVAKFKITSRKPSYHLQEMVNIDLALLNISEQPVYFPSLLNAQVYYRNQQGFERRSTKYFVVDTIPTPQMYVLQKPNRISFASHQLLPVCEPRAFEQVTLQLNAATKSKELFERDSFVNWGESCLDIKNPGTYTITFEMTNWAVIVSPTNPGVRTAVGTLRSNPLVIRIVR